MESTVKANDPVKADDQKPDIKIVPPKKKSGHKKKHDPAEHIAETAFELLIEAAWSGLEGMLQGGADYLKKSREK